MIFAHAQASLSRRMSRSVDNVVDMPIIFHCGAMMAPGRLPIYRRHQRAARSMSATVVRKTFAEYRRKHASHCLTNGIEDASQATIVTRANHKSSRWLARSPKYAHLPAAGDVTLTPIKHLLNLTAISAAA